MKSDLKLSALGIREPWNIDELISPLEIDLVLVPGVSFDSRGYRIGYGGGYYDRFINQLGPDTLLVGVCFDSRTCRPYR